LVVYGKGGDLLDELQEVDGGVKEGGGKFPFKVDVGVTTVSYERSK
jgi:hypothetical protein